jgi:hypothetical protein
VQAEGSIATRVLGTLDEIDAIADGGRWNGTAPTR